MKRVDQVVSISDPVFRLRHLINSRIVAMGDSSAFGVGDFGDALPSVGAGWVGRFAHDVKSNHFVNVAKNGARARDLMSYQLPSAIAFEPDIVLICIGTNDVLRGDFSPEEIRQSLEELIRKLERCGAVVVFLGLPDPLVFAPGPRLLREILSRRIMKVNEILSSFKSHEFVCYVDTWNSKKVGEKRMWHLDRMHPSPYGHQVISDLVRKELAIPLKQKKKLPIGESGTQNDQLIWLATNGLKWFLKRSVDLIPALIWLVTKELIQKRSF